MIDGETLVEQYDSVIGQYKQKPRMPSDDL